MGEKPRRVTKTIPLLLLLVVTVIVVLTVSTVVHDKNSHRTEAELNLRVLNNLVASDISRLLSGITIALSGLNDVMEAQGRVERFDKDVHRMLLRKKLENPHFMDILVVDAKGSIEHWTGEGMPPDIRDREYIRYHLDKPSQNALFVGEPKLSKVHIGKWFFGVSRAFYDEGGSLERIVVAVVDIASLQGKYAEVLAQNKATLLLMDKKGTVYLRYPAEAQLTGQRVLEVEKYLSRGISSVVLSMVSPLDGKRRMANASLMNDYPLVTVVSYEEAAVFAEWRTRTILVGTFVGLVITMIIVFGYSLVCQQVRLYQFSTRDELTGLYNRRHFLALASSEFDKARRHGFELSVVMADIDNFKRVNDTFGHAVGDEVIKAFASVMSKSVRVSDIVARFGGEEFIMLLPYSNKEGGCHAAEKVRATFEKKECISVGADITASFGVASLTEGDYDIQELIKRADDALYEAKRNGRNRVCDCTMYQA